MIFIETGKGGIWQLQKIENEKVIKLVNVHFGDIKDVLQKPSNDKGVYGKKNKNKELSDRSKRKSFKNFFKMNINWGKS